MSEEDSISSQLNKYYKLKANYETSISDIKKKLYIIINLVRKKKGKNLRNINPNV